MLAMVPVWAHVALLVAVLGLCALIYLRSGNREDRLRKRAGRTRRALEKLELLHDVLSKKLSAQSVELARYRGQIPMELRVTQVLLDDDGKPMLDGTAAPKQVTSVQPKQPKRPTG